MRSVSEKKVTEKVKINLLCSVASIEKRAFYEIMLENIVETGRPQMTIWRMRIACWIHNSTNIHSECVILTAFPLQQWLHERASMLRYTHIACLVLIIMKIMSSGTIYYPYILKHEHSFSSLKM
jgi:hypothetical protein